MAAVIASGLGGGARLPRKEDARHLRGRGRFVADLRFPRTQEVAFVRSAVAHARLRSIEIPPEILAMVASKSLARRRLRLSQTRVISATHRRGRVSKPAAWSERLTISTVH